MWGQYSSSHSMHYVNTLRPRQNGCHFADDTFKRIFVNKNVRIFIEISLNLFLGVQLTIFQHWFRLWLGAVQATSHYLNRWWFVYRRIYASLGLNELTLGRMTTYGVGDLYGAKQLPILMMTYCKIDPCEQSLMKIESKCYDSHSAICIAKCFLQNGSNLG